MKEGWTIGKFSDIFDLQMGKTPSRDNPSYWGGANTWVSIADMNRGKYIYDTKEHITNSAVSESGIHCVSKDTVIMSFKLSIGKVAIATKDLYTNEAIMSFNTKQGYDILPDYIYYYLKGYRWQGMNKAVMGMTLNKKAISNNTFSFPNIPQQQHIVEELDLLSSIIEKKKTQLRELDNLAQSLFYEMFGDPITNEKGWKVKKLKDCCKNYDSQRKPITAKDRIKGSIPYYGASGVVDYVRDFIFDGDFLLVSEDGANLVLRSTPIAFCIKGKTWVNNHAHVLKFDTLFQQKYIEFSINLRDISMMVTGCAQPKLTQAALNNMIILYPPLSLQQQFASKIEAIEHQKELIKQSIKEVETLFNSRMDYYFN